MFKKKDGFWIYNCTKTSREEADGYVDRMTKFYTNPVTGKINVELAVFRYDDNAIKGLRYWIKRVFVKLNFNSHISPESDK